MKKRLISALLALVLIIISNAPLSVAASLSNSNGTENTDNYPYIGYQEGSTGLTNKLYVEKKGDPSVRRIVYCFNKSLHWPDTKVTLKDLAYKKTTGSADHFENEVNTNSKYKGQELIDKLKFVLLNGYPNANKIQNALNLTYDQMQKVTQMAVWHFTDNEYTRLGHFQSVSELEALALATLIEMANPIANGESTLGADVLNHFENEHKKTHPDYVRPESIEMPENSTLDLYIQNGVKQEDGKGYQNLLGANLINTNTKEIIEIPKEKPKKEISISKYGKEGPLGDAELSIAKSDSPDTIIQTIISSEESPSKIEVEVDTKYILNEIVAPQGYQKITGVKFTVDSNGNIKVNDTGQYEDGTKPDEFSVSTHQNNLYITDKEKIEEPDQPEEPTPTNTKLIIRKYAKGDYKKLLEGAELELYKISDDGTEGELVEGKSFISDDKGKEFELIDGSYILKEKTPPSGYKTADDINFEVKNGKVLIDDKEAPKGISNPFSYEAYSDYLDENVMVPGNPYGKFYYVKKEGQKQVVYCFNATKHAPADSYDHGTNIEYTPQHGEVKYNKIINPDELYKYAQNPRIASAELATKVTRIIHAGYPNNKTDIQKLGLTDTQLRAATQLAIYYYTDSADLTDEGLEKLGDGFQLLKGNGETESKIKDYAKALINYSNSDQAPSDLSYDFYVANNGHYQNLIGTSYDTSDLHYVISMEDEENKVEDKETKVSFSKTDILGEELKGATLQIKDKSNNEVVQEWTSGDKPQTFGLKPGKYEFVETVAPKGYKIATAIDFEITSDGKVVANKDSLKTEGSENIITMVDGYETIDEIVIKKMWDGKPVNDLPIYFRLHKGVEGVDNNIEDPTIPTKELGGASNPIKFEDKDIHIKGLSLPTINQYGNKVKYSLTEVTLKDNLYTKWEKAGYETIVESKIEGNTLTFTVTNKEKETKETNVFFSKQNILGKELKGAKLQIKDKETGKVVKEWISGETAQTFGLKPGKYEFVETAAPKGYKIATAIDFEITTDGEIVANKESLKTVGSSKILVMVDDYKETNVFFSKQNILGKELKGAKLQIKDKETGKVVKEWISGETAQTFGLKPGKYEFVETAAPKGYKIATAIDFEITTDGEIVANKESLKTVGSSKILVMVDDYKETNVFFSKQDILGKELKGAKLQIKDKETGKVVKEWISGETAQTFGLKPGKYEFVETIAPKGYKIATAIDFEITTDGEIVANKESLKTVGSSNILVMVDEYDIEEIEKDNSNPKTNDEFNPIYYLGILLLTSFALLSVSRKSKNNSHKR